MKPGIYPNMSHDEYHAVEAVQNSYLSQLAITPAHAKMIREEKYCFIEGQANHMLVLDGREVFEANVIEADAGKIDAKAYLQTVEENPGKLVLLRGGLETAYQCARAIRQHPGAASLLSTGDSETSAFAIEKGTGLLCKVRPDHVNHEHSILLDLKFMREGGADKRKFSWEIKERYARQAGWYRAIYSAAAGREYEKFAFIVVEKAPPYRTEVRELEEEYLEWGWGDAMYLLRLEAQCRKNNNWPHYQNAGVDVIDLPDYMREDR
jgi:hypothetical protein